MVVWPVVLHTTVMIVFWLMSVTCSGSCPENSALREALTCLHNLTNGDHSKVSISPADIKQTKSFCENGNFQDSVRCLRGLHSSCQDPVKLEMLKKYADPNAWEAGFNRLCHSMSLYIKHGDCIIKQNAAIQKCVESKKDIEVSSNSGVTYNFNEDEKEYVEDVCGYFRVLNHCYSNQIGNQCGVDIQAVLSDFNSGLTPPICRDFSFAAFHSAGSRSEQSAITLFACVTSFLAWMMPS
ncbi:uncharacterized protein LOC111110244 isoform X2 [Crassostrea virginica]|uniref:Uncharacterized protein LOC111110244 isoform X2 n=1 Tax=Crassostrea virginica TaxID=6565 RepID=A0A8B8BG75_CRAVI|nr:uncharacterized protein LOC111110244 isoform X2 [Crassostrea virginica]XP_022302361.1 uncharacterized protein LOC111110244 isoform X2 [Crassostrea virginica]XP_022302362.1 uncharacterized protein LOC111110244 isoform X2 [Crassostrea virginica]XP_022302363.1 uncharacterized protein LOC111110244 isoform X2 [Crassostrea virginica]XP_022302364.1 uncharacterized protein LOC111110244 isoform X2 [Crassostrea virginica]XP_022302365.1 uncharacterized protein LOC111110244 isoform X2 [Crassostrea virg